MRFEIAGKRMEKVEAAFATEAKGAFVDPWSMGNVGGGLPRTCVIVTDYTWGWVGFVERPCGVWSIVLGRLLPAAMCCRGTRLSGDGHP